MIRVFAGSIRIIAQTAGFITMRLKYLPSSGGVEMAPEIQGRDSLALKQTNVLWY